MKKLATIFLIISTVAFGQKPVVKITSPAAGAVFTNPASFTFSATATVDESKPSGTGIRSVKFYKNGTLWFTESSAPYAQVKTIADTGIFTLKIEALSLNGYTTTTSLRITVKAPAEVTTTVNTTTTVSSTTTDLTKTLDSLRIQYKNFKDSVRGMIRDSLSGLRTFDLVRHEIPKGAVDGINKVFTLSGNIIPGSERIYRFGTAPVQPIPANAYTVDLRSVPTRIIFSVAPPVGSWMEVEYLK